MTDLFVQTALAVAGSLELSKTGSRRPSSRNSGSDWYWTPRWPCSTASRSSTFAYRTGSDREDIRPCHDHDPNSCRAASARS
jgi:hypothetical protein